MFIAELDVSCQHLLPLELPLERMYIDHIEGLLNNVFSAMAIVKILWDKTSQYHNM